MHIYYTFYIIVKSIEVLSVDCSLNITMSFLLLLQVGLGCGDFIKQGPGRFSQEILTSVTVDVLL